MRGNDICRGWLPKHANGGRAESLAVLRLNKTGTPQGLDNVRRRFVELARESHLDGRARHCLCGGNGGDDNDGDGDKGVLSSEELGNQHQRSRASPNQWLIGL